ncbi:MAG: hypothetical protein A3I68_01615 [Candidatus Melainabacteria bacterium RIFCSPLOWO2_02_FULL_35_15]|nr:MAG: hypothetical protein A3F80_04925 [Candidatus Melainabacteria bacterium RIFCSPLOWO2_12_FULL_35_11]OGI13008.1 MAG: hypothetical protein A3I68_01615 [Candidatus Melainabacteria bacterium RIFCSPLOWO2_02_FULL_35_15]
MQSKLQSIADVSSISSGYTFRGPVEAEITGDIFVVQGKNLIANAELFDTANFSRVSSIGIRNPYFLQHNDVLLTSRGSGLGTFRSSLFTSDKKNVIASSSVIIIRSKDITVIPKYISLYLNSPEGQQDLLQIVTGGSYIQSLLVKNLSDLLIPIPPLHIQKSIVALQENVFEQEKLLKRRQKIQQNLVDASFMNLINK